MSEKPEYPWDQGRPLLVVRVSLPELDALNTLPELLRGQVLANVLRVRRLFRSRTLPLPGNEARLLPGHVLEMGELSRLLDDVLRKGIDDKTVRDELLRPPARQEDDFGSRVYTRLLRTGDDKRFETVEAGALLGKSWYRYREPSYLEEVQYYRDEAIRNLEAHKRGESPVFNPMPPEPPAPSRRRSAEE